VKRGQREDDATVAMLLMLARQEVLSGRRAEAMRLANHAVSEITTMMEATA
jgi:hypothetical protein